jgi:aminopeptidase C
VIFGVFSIDFLFTLSEKLFLGFYFNFLQKNFQKFRLNYTIYSVTTQDLIKFLFYFYDKYDRSNGHFIDIFKSADFAGIKRLISILLPKRVNVNLKSGNHGDVQKLIEIFKDLECKFFVGRGL